MSQLLPTMMRTLDQYDAYILDIWGVLHNGLQAYDGVLDMLKAMRANDKKVLLLSNSPNRGERVAEYKLRPMGISDDLYDFILTSGDSTALYMHEHKGKKVYCLWDEEHPTILDDAECIRVATPEDADIVLASLVPHDAQLEDYIDILERCLAKGLTFICANPDKVVNVGDMICLCAGSLAEYYEEKGGDVVWHGKPYEPIYEKAYELLGRPDKSKICAVGDSLRTDVQGAGNFGIDVYWCLSGIHREEVMEADQIHEKKIVDALEEWQFKPTFVVDGLR